MNAVDAAPAAPVPPRPRLHLLAELAAPILLLAWRLTWYDLETVWRDWVAILSVYWIFTIFGRRTKAWEPVTFLVCLGLLGIYLYRQFPQALSSLRFAW